MHRAREKRGLSTIIAAVFMTAILVLGLGVMTQSLNFQNNFGETVVDRAEIEMRSVDENIALRDVRIDNSRFNMTVANTGTVPVKLVNMWVTNTTATNGWHQQYTLDKTINPGEYWANFGTSLPLVAKNSSSYKISVITERGTSSSFQILSSNNKAIKMDLFLSPRSVPTGQDVSVMFGVTNNMTDGSIIQSLEPKINWTRTEAPSGTITASATLISGPTPSVEPSLAAGETVFYRWVYNVVGDVGDKINFNATLVNAKQGNYITETAEVVVDSFSGQSNISFQVLSQGGQPGLFVKKGNFAKCTTGSCTNTISSLTFQPKAVIFFWTRQTVDGLASGLYAGYGFATSATNERAIAIASDDNIGSNSDTGRSSLDTRSITIISDATAPTVSAVGDVTAWTTNGFTITWTTNENRADIIHYLALGGSDITNAVAGSFAATASAGTQGVTGVGFEPDFLMFLSADQGLTTATRGKASIGFAAGAEGADEASVAVSLEDAQSVPSQDTWIRQRTDRSTNELSDSGAEDHLATVDSFDANGFTINKSAADATTFFYLALKGGKYKVGSFNKCATTPTCSGQSVSTVGFKPAGLIPMSGNQLSSTGIQAEGRISFGASDGTTEGATWWHDKDQVNPTDSNQRTSTTKIAVHGSRGTLNAEADLTAFGSNGFTLDWTTNNSVVEEIIYAAFGNATTSSLTVSSPDVKINMTNTGTNTIWIDKNARVVFNNTASGAVYAGLIQSWKNFTSPITTGTINSTRHSDAWEPSRTLELRFSWPRVIPGDTSSSAIVSGQQYQVYVRLSGYDEQGQFVLKTIPVGTAQVT